MEEEQEAIVDMVMDDYTTAWPAVTKPLRDALERWGSSEQARELQEAVELLGRGIAVDDVDVNRMAKEWAQRRARKDRHPERGADGGEGVVVGEVIVSNSVPGSVRRHVRSKPG